MNAKFYHAAATGDVIQCISLYYTPGSYIDIDMRHGLSGMTPLSAAIGLRSGQLNPEEDEKTRNEVVKFLIRNGVDASIENMNGTTALQLAVCRSGMKFVNILLEQCSGIDLEKRFNGQTPLCMAVATSLRGTHVYKEQILSLLEHGADVNAGNAVGKSILSEAGVDKWLLDAFMKHGLRLDNRYNNGQTLLHSIVYSDTVLYKHPDPTSSASLVQAILLYGADVTIKDNTGRTAQQVALHHFPREHPICDAFISHRYFNENGLLFASACHIDNSSDGYGHIPALPSDVVDMIWGHAHPQIRNFEDVEYSEEI